MIVGHNSPTQPLCAARKNLPMITRARIFLATLAKSPATSSLSPPTHFQEYRTPANMDAAVGYSIDDLASQTIIKKYGDATFVLFPIATTFYIADVQPATRMVTIPGCSMLPESERAAVFAQAQYVTNILRILEGHIKLILLQLD